VRDVDAKLKGEGIDQDAVPEPSTTNVIDLMAALKRSIAATEPPPPAAVAAATATSAKTPKAKAAPTSKAAPSPKPSRKRAS
jgi:non-homologous end joining protein Ku